ncbi:hypothetical protein T06_1159 [Trichinella sp. T6]|nr:hypothetical protein T06_1159 [Trichinella sp. T6]
MLLIPEVLLDYGLNFRKSFSLLFNSFHILYCNRVKKCDEAIASAILNFTKFQMHSFRLQIYFYNKHAFVEDSFSLPVKIPILTLLVLLSATCNAASAAAPPFFHFHCNAY